MGAKCNLSRILVNFPVWLPMLIPSVDLEPG